MRTTTIEFADGATIEGSIGAVPPYLVISVTPEVAKESFSIFLDSENMKTITYYYGVFKDVYRGDHIVTNIEPRPLENKVLIWILSPEDEVVEQYVPTVPTEYL